MSDTYEAASTLTPQEAGTLCRIPQSTWEARNTWNFRNTRCIRAQDSQCIREFQGTRRGARRDIRNSSTAPVGGWRAHHPVWTYLIMLLSSLAAHIVSFALSAETLQLARHPHQQLSAISARRPPVQQWRKAGRPEIHPFRRDRFPQCLLRHSSRIGFVTVAVLGISHSSTAMVALCTLTAGSQHCCMPTGFSHSQCTL